MEKRFLINFIILLNVVMAFGQYKSGDAQNGVSLDSIVVYGNTTDSRLRTTGSGATLWNMSMMNELPKILGNADPIHYAQALPGVSTNGEFDAGLHVFGCENSHNYITIDGTPLYGASHLLGLFSIFNASHFQQMVLRKNSVQASSADRLGAVLNMQTHYMPTDTVTGEVAVGMISSQGTVRVPVTKNAELAVSLRASYLNLFFGSLLKGNDGAKLKYSFNDINVTYNHILNKNNRLLFNFYYGNDNAEMDEKQMMANINVKWANIMGSLQWHYDNGTLRICNNAYYTKNVSKGSLGMAALNALLPSSISEWGNKLSFDWKGWTAGMDLSLYRIEPQIPEVISSYIKVHAEKETTHSSQVSAYIDKEWKLSNRLMLATGLRGSLYHIADHNYTNLSPIANISYKVTRNWDMTLGYSYRHQYLIQTGMSSINTPLEFWISAGSYGQKPQKAHALTFSTRYTTDNGTYTIGLEAYSKWLSNQVEYNGTIYSFIATGYSLEDMLLRGNGHNYGASVMLAKNKGWITGWIAYAYGKAMRTYNTEILKGTFPSSHEREHEVNGIVTFHLGKRWDIGFNGVWAIGTPFTAPKQYYLLNSYLMTEFADHNANRLRSYFRIDGSVNFHLKPTRRIHEHGLNLSVYNLVANENDMFYYMKLTVENYQYKRMTFMLRVMPSISYYMKF